jgi:hypothetical protein
MLSGARWMICRMRGSRGLSASQTVVKNIPARMTIPRSGSSRYLLAADISAKA